MQTTGGSSRRHPKPWDMDFNPDDLPMAICNKLSNLQIDDIYNIVETHGPRCLNWTTNNLINNFSEPAPAKVSVFLFACAAKWHVGVQVLLELKADPRVTDSNGHDALTTAVLSGSSTVVHVLVRHLDSILLHTPLAITKGNCTRQELTTGCVTYTLAPDQITELPHTVGTAITLAFNVPHSRDDTTVNTCMDDICKDFIQGCDHVSSDKSILYERDIALHIQDPDTSVENPTLLFMMLRKGYFESAFCILVFSKCHDALDPNLGRDRFGNTPLHYAISLKYWQVACRLVEHGADMLAPCTPRRDLPVDTPPPLDLAADVGNAPKTPLDIYKATIERWRGERPRDWGEGSVDILRSTVNDMSDSFVYPITPMWLWRERPVQDLPPLSAQEISVRFLPDMPRTCKWRLPRCWDFLDSDQVVHEKALALWHHQCRYRGKAFHGWHALPQEVVRIIISHILLFPHHPKALDARLSRLTDAYHRGQAARR